MLLRKWKSRLQRLNLDEATQVKWGNRDLTPRRFAELTPVPFAGLVPALPREATGLSRQEGAAKSIRRLYLGIHS